MRAERAVFRRLRAATRSLIRAFAGAEKFLKLISRLADDGARLQRERRAHAGEHGGVASVGLGELA
jgi:hypothetical protein